MKWLHSFPLIKKHLFMKKIALLGIVGFLSLAASTFAQTTWTDGAFDQMWSSTSNWNPGVVPGPTTAVQIGTQPTGNQIGIDTGVATTVASITFNNTLTNSVDIAPVATETLQVNGAITNNSAYTDSFSLAVFAGASAVWSGPLSFTAQAVIGTNTITLANAITFSSLAFDITNATTFGHFLGAGTATVTGATINIGGTYTGQAGDLFHFTPGAFTGATLGTLPSLTAGLTWNTTNFTSNGTLSVQSVPEPATWALFATGLAAVAIIRSRRVSA